MLGGRQNSIIRPLHYGGGGGGEMRGVGSTLSTRVPRVVPGKGVPSHTGIRRRQSTRLRGGKREIDALVGKSTQSAKGCSFFLGIGRGKQERCKGGGPDKIKAWAEGGSAKKIPFLVLETVKQKRGRVKLSALSCLAAVDGAVVGVKRAAGGGCS